MGTTGILAPGDDHMAEELKKGSDSCTESSGMGSDSAAKALPNSHDAARRRAIKAGLIGVPLILTLKGQTAWARQLSGGSGSTASNPVPQPPPKP
jgi:hypothetical protein